MRPDGGRGLLVAPSGIEAERSLGWQVAHYVETFCCHGPGDLRGEPMEVGEELQAFLVLAYALNEHGRRIVSHKATLSRCKGWSKSEKAGGIVVAEFTGPVRFDHWAAKGETSWWGYEYEQGEPVGRPVQDPFIRCLATEEEQSGNTYDNVTVMLEDAQLKWADLFGDIDYGRTAQSSTRIFKSGGGEVRPSTSGSASKDGGKESFAVGDEPHLYVGRELRAMDATVARNLTKRPMAEPWLLYTTTMFALGEDSVGEANHREALEIAKGRLKNRGVLYDHREGPDPESEFDWDDDDQLLEALVETAGEAAFTANEQRIADIRDPKTLKSDAVRFYLNRPTKTEKQGVDPRKWDSDEMTRMGEKPPRGTRVGGGFDGSISGDATAIVGCTADLHRFVWRMWERPEGKAGKDWTVPRHEVHAAWDEFFAFYDVGRVLCDTPKWESEVGDENSGWVQRFGKNRDGNDLVVAYPTYSEGRFATACERFATSVELKRGTHDGDPRLRAHVLAMVKRKVRVKGDDGDGRTRFVFDKGDTRKIDAGVACTLAEEAAATMPPPKKKNRAAFV